MRAGSALVDKYDGNYWLGLKKGEDIGGYSRIAKGFLILGFLNGSGHVAVKNTIDLMPLEISLDKIKQRMIKKHKKGIDERRKLDLKDSLLLVSIESPYLNETYMTEMKLKFLNSCKSKIPLTKKDEEHLALIFEVYVANALQKLQIEYSQLSEKPIKEDDFLNNLIFHILSWEVLMQKPNY